MNLEKTSVREHRLPSIKFFHESFAIVFFFKKKRLERTKLTNAIQKKTFQNC